jgi:hypothetical protein
MADGEGLFGLAKKVVPPQARFFAQTMFGDKTKPLTQNDLTPEELRYIQDAIEASQKRLQSNIENIKKAKTYSDLPISSRYGDLAEKKIGDIQDENIKFQKIKEAYIEHERQLNKGYGNVQYSDYAKGNPIKDTLGRFTYQIQPDGSVHVSDMYDFYNVARAKNVAKYEQENPVFKALDAGTLALSKAFSGDIKEAAGTIGEAYIGRDGRPVDIRYDPSMFRLPPSVDNFQSPMYTDPFGNTIR